MLSFIRIESRSMALSGECIVGEKIVRRKPRAESRNGDSTAMRLKSGFSGLRKPHRRKSCFSLETFRVFGRPGGMPNARRRMSDMDSGKSRENFFEPVHSATKPCRHAAPGSMRISNLKHFVQRAETRLSGDSAEPLLRLVFLPAGLLFASRSARQSTT
ncbi:hypothetical protein [Burkholderia territorii]|uniref:hypothetical protein n=1 Tax=Burkholderia territorii TaxID=1503055 RepID=UPI0012D97528|nr:hypothetical protein [Burkholderia territorii]